MEKKAIYVSVLNQGWIRPELSHTLNEMSSSSKYNVGISYWGKKPITHNRNTIVQDFLQKKVFDYLLMIDSDNVPSSKIVNLADFQKDIIAGLSFGLQRNFVIPSAFRRRKDGLYTPYSLRGDEGLVEVDAVGAGQLMISRKVLETIGFPFQNKYDRDGIKKMGLDMVFCEKAKKMGFKIYVHTHYISDHWVSYNLRDTYQVVYKNKELAEENAQLQEEIKKLKAQLNAKNSQ